MLLGLQKQIEESIGAALGEICNSQNISLNQLALEVPANKQHGEFSTNIALKSAKLFRKPPMEIAEEWAALIRQGIENSHLSDKVNKVVVLSPGFINFHLSLESICDVLREVLKVKQAYGSAFLGNGQKVQVEFVSANPTGPLSVAHARQAAVGDVLANVMSFLGFSVDREYFVNDEGNQIVMLGQSIFCRAKELLGIKIEFPENGYQGEYICDIARKFLQDRSIVRGDELEKFSIQELSQYGVRFLMDIIRRELDDFGVKFDNWSFQSEIASLRNVEEVLALLKKRGVLYEHDGALWFRSTDFGDDKDRVVRKRDANYTYLAPDIAYHKNKYERGYQKIFNIWGPDHHGYIPRIRAAVQALGYDPHSLEVLIVQLATIYRDRRPVSMSTRRGQYISLREVMNEVGVDAARFFFLMRGISAHLDFDLDLAKKETPENPVYYIQYAYARIHSILKKASAENVFPQRESFLRLKEDEEIDLIKKIAGFSNILLICYQQRDVFALVNYLIEMATCFHRFYDRHRVLDDENRDLSAERLALIDSARIVLENGLKLLGVSAPEQM